MPRPTITTTVEVGQIRDASGEIFINLDTIPGILRMDASLYPAKVMAILAWVNRWGDQDTSTVIVCKDAATLDEYLSRPRVAGHWFAVWRSDRAVVAPQVVRYNG